MYGFVACVLLVLIATQMRKVLMRKEEDYYDRLVFTSQPFVILLVGSLLMVPVIPRVAARQRC